MPDSGKEGKKKSKWKPIGKAWVWKEMLVSKAWLNLSGVSPQVYGLFLLEVKTERISKRGPKEKQFRLKDNGNLMLPYRFVEATYGITQPRFTRAIDDLVEHGFIDIVEIGSGTGRRPTVYRLSERWREYGKPTFAKHERCRGFSGFCEHDDSPPF